MTPAQEDEMLEKLTAIHTKMEMLITNGGSKGMIPDLRNDVDEHDKQINRWKGAVSIIGFVLLLLGGTEVWHILSAAQRVVK
jgi:hypothetical protein